MLPELARGGLGQLLDALAAQGFAGASQASREQLLRNVTLASPDAAAGIAALTGLTLFFTYGLPGPRDRPEPELGGVRLPGPGRRAPPQAPKPLEPARARRRRRRSRPTSCVVGSGAGGGVIAGTLAPGGPEGRRARGRRLLQRVRLQPARAARPTRTCSGAAARRRPPTSTCRSRPAPRSAAAPSSTGPTACARTRGCASSGRASTASRASTAPTSTRHLDAVCERLGVNDDCSRPERAAASAMKEGARGARLVVPDASIRNADPARYDPSRPATSASATSPARSSRRAKTYLADAVGARRRIVVRCRAERVLVEGGRAAGRRGGLRRPRDRRRRRVTVRAPQVVVACGSLESPALLLRSGIGGAGGRALPAPASVHRDLRHLRRTTSGLVGRRRTAALVDEFANVEDGYGFLIEGAQYTTGVGGSAIAVARPRAEHKADDGAAAATRRRFIGLLRDRGHGRVDDRRAPARPCPSTTLDDELDVRNAHAAAHRRADPPARGRGRPRRSADGRRRCRAGGAATTSTRSSSAAQRIPLRAGGHAAVLRPPDGHAAGWAPTRDLERRRPVGRAARHAGRVDRRRQRVPDRRRAPTR